MGQNQEDEQRQSLELCIDQGYIEEVLDVVKSGKEATVYCCRAAGNGGSSLVAAKLYRSRKVRRFANDALYNEGRLRQKQRRETRAIETKTRFGREASFEKWVADEYETLSVLEAAGADVPRPLAIVGRVILMEYVGNEGEPAPPLSSVLLERGEAEPLFERVLWNIETMLAANRVHGDLSAFNVLYRSGMPCIIDFPQAVDPRYNHHALTLLERDLENICRYFARCGVAADPWRLARDLWARFLRSEL